MGASHLYSINPSHIINAISDQPNFATAPAPVRPVPATAWLFPLRLSHLRRPVLSAPSPHSPAFRQMCTQSTLYRYPSWFNEKLFNHRDTTSPSSSPRTSFAFVRQRVCPDSPLRQCLLVFDQCLLPQASAVPCLFAKHRLEHHYCTVPVARDQVPSAFPFAKSVHSDETRTAQIARHFQLRLKSSAPHQRRAAGHQPYPYPPKISTLHRTLHS